MEEHKKVCDACAVAEPYKVHQPHHSEQYLNYEEVETVALNATIVGSANTTQCTKQCDEKHELAGLLFYAGCHKVTACYFPLFSLLTEVRQM